ncbi:MAG: hypothetical protein ACREGR_04265 [Minisyncoccia bacterium]
MAEPAGDSKEQLLAEVKVVRRAGLGKLVPSAVPHLGRIASNVVPNELLDPSKRIERVLRLAMDPMGDAYGGAASLLLGTSPETRGLSVTARRRKAAQYLGDGKGADAFYKTDEPRILQDLVVQLLALEVGEEAEHRSMTIDVLAASPQATQETAQKPPDVEHAGRGNFLHAEVGDSQGSAEGPDAYLDAYDSDGSVSGGPQALLGHRMGFLKPMTVLGLVALCAISALAATSTWPFGADGRAQIPTPNAGNGALVTCLRSNGKVEPAPSIPSGPNPVHVALQVQTASAPSWTYDLNHLRPGTIARFLLSYSNASSAVQNQVVLRTNLAPGSLLVPDSTCLYDASHPSGVKIQSNDVERGGINIGNFGSGANAYLLFSVALPPSGDLLCGKTTITTVGVARPSGLNEFENSAVANLEKPCGTAAPTGTAQVSDSISLKVGLPGSKTSKLTAFARIPAGDPIAWAIIVVHESPSQLNSAVLLDQIPGGVMVVPGSVKLFNGNYPNGYIFPASAVQDDGRQINLDLGDYIPLSTQDASNGGVSATVTFYTEFVAVSPNNCARRTITNSAWFGTSQYAHTLHAVARAEVSC